jgi:hypothetical protein
MDLHLGQTPGFIILIHPFLPMKTIGNNMHYPCHGNPLFYERLVLYEIIIVISIVTSHYWQDLDLSGFKNLKGLALLLPALNEKLLSTNLNRCFIHSNPS